MSLKSFSAICLLATIFSTSSGHAQTIKSDFPVDSVQGLQWLDREAKTMSLALLALYPNGCYQLEQTTAMTSADEMKIYVRQSVLVSDEMCTQAIVPQTDYATIYFPAYGQCEVIDSADLRILGWIILDETGFSFRSAKK